MKVGFLSLGCPKNLVDGEVMMGLVRQAGHELTADADDADILVVNTCAFIDEAKQESIDAILEMAQKKTSKSGSGKAQRLVVAGCLGERYRDELKKEIPEIDAVLGTGDVPEIVAAISGVKTSGASPLTFFHKNTEYRTQNTEAGPTYLYGAETPRVLATPGHYAYIKIAEGCDYTCAFCIIPTLRGSYRSRTEDSVVQEAESLVARGVKELLLISQDTTFFGNDRVTRSGDVRKERGALGRLLRRLNAIDGLEWIRLLYLYPTTITDDTLDAMAECEKVCKYVDLPLQHASADVLRRMRRPGNRQAYDKLLARIRTRVPGVTLRTTFIVGFPGETDAEFAELEQFIRETHFDHVGVFTYSHEEGTRAHAMDDDVPAAVKRKRRDALMRLQKQIVAKRQKTRRGEIVRVMIDGPSPESPLVWQGRLEGQAPDIDAVVYLDQCDPGSLVPGAVVRARIEGARGYDIVAAPLG